MQRSVLNKVISTIREFKLISDGEKVLVAVSGGPDSVFLLHVLLKLRSLFKIELAVAHLNHGLRPEADEEQDFVRELARQNGLPFFTRRIDVREFAKRNSMGIEEAARILRYRFLREAMAEWGGDVVALGHNMNDLAETVLFNLFRGSGVVGAAGIPPRNDVFIRPIIEVTRDEIMDYLRSNPLPFKIDRSNYDTNFTRNYLRHKVIPVIKNRFPSFETNIAHFSFILKDQADFMKKIARDALKELRKPSPQGESILDRWKLLSYHRAHRFWIYSVMDMGFELTYRKFKDMERVLEKGGRISLGNGWKLESSESDFRFFRHDLKLSETVTFETGARVAIPSANMELHVSETTQNMTCEGEFVACFPLETLAPPFRLRRRRAGDRIRLKTGWRSLKRVFIDKKIPRWRRDLIPVIEDQNRILWIVGVAKAFLGDFKVSAQIKMEVKKQHEGKFWIYD